MSNPAVDAAEKIPESRGWVALILTWVAPGLGHWYLGRRPKGVFLFVLVTGLYLGGMILAGFLNVNPDRHPFYFIGEAFYGGATLVAWLTTQSLRIESFNPSHDVGLLFTCVAGLLNVIVMVDIYEILNPRVESDQDE